MKLRLIAIAILLLVLFTMLHGYVFKNNEIATQPNKINDPSCLLDETSGLEASEQYHITDSAAGIPESTEQSKTTDYIETDTTISIVETEATYPMEATASTQPANTTESSDFLVGQTNPTDTTPLGENETDIDWDV